MSITTNLGSGGPTLQSSVDGSSEHYQGTKSLSGMDGFIFAGAIITPTYVRLSLSSQGMDTVLLGTAGKRIYVMGGAMTGDKISSVAFRSDNIDITGKFSFDVGTSIALGFIPTGLFRTEVGEDLKVFVTAASTPVNIGGHLVCAVV